ncbi:hypothetical protein [Cupriavidus sp. IK-TO18]|uniref:hypothetical protein n=1 Tax=Cupriavidus sp. IK-TO18 TaxID=2782182 RepID=UPI0018996140|nr:hypothetical protein [Cupriavidus sp. IK-TO18]MBF6987020.1 hypothetical protein [Cupriavidus sp. IK-TO18]
MNKIMIVGHPTSEYQDVEALLVKCGMAPALSSRREGLTPAEISLMLLKAHRSPDRTVLGSIRSLPQVEAGPIWHGMALDLMLGNIEQKLWGWADPHALQLLDYWKNLDPSIAFVLVYDSPESLLVRSIESGNDFNVLEAMVAEWCAYNQALLHFFYRNAERSLLVHAQQVRASASGYLQQVQARINAPMKSLLEVPSNDTAENELQHDLDIRGSGFCNLLSSKTEKAGAIRRYLAKAIVCEYPEAEQLYEELQTAANLPLVVSGEGAGIVHEAWRELVAIEHNEATHRVLLETQESEFAGRIEELQASMRTMHEKLGKVQDESLVQLKKLHETQEQSERYHNELLEESARASQLLSLSEDRKKAFEKLEKELQDQKSVASAAQQELTSLSEGHSKDGARVVRLEKDLDALTKESAILRVQRREMEAALLGVQEELERSHIELRKALEKGNSNSAEQSRAGEQLKLANQHKGMAEARVAELESSRIVLEKRNGGLQREINALVDRIQRMQEEWEGRVPSSGATTKRQDRYGAADRVRRQLSYRLGATMIKHSYSVGGWLTMPMGLAKEAKRFRTERRQRGKEKLPSIASYRDAQEADRMRRHLSYRLGAKMLGNATSPLGWLRMPFILRKEVIAFREEKRNKY